MLWLLEDEKLLQQQIDKAFVEIIPFHNKVHPTLNKVSLVYINLYQTKGFLMPISHTEARSLDITSVYALLRSIKTIHTRNKKQLLHYFKLDNIIDISFKEIPNLDNLPIYDFYYRQYPQVKDINRIIPISKHYENCENIFEKVKNIEPKLDLYQEASSIFQQVEKNGIKIKKEIIEQFFKFDQEFYSVKDNKIYTQYNLYTTTRRPSNSFNGVNFSALNKDNGCRKGFIPENDYFVELDLSAYHPTLISKLVNYDFKGNGIYEHFSTLFKKNIQQTKILLLSQLYGGIKEEYKNLEYFKKVQEFIDKKWVEFENQEYIKCNSGYIIQKDKVENMNPNKLFNYILQELETAENILIIKDILKLLENKQTKLVLYVYDSFILDLKDEEKQLIEEIKNLLEEKQLKFKVKQSLSL